MDSNGFDPITTVRTTTRRTILKAGAGAVLGGAGLILAAAEAPAAAPRRPFPQHRVYAAGTIRPNHRSRAALDDDVRAAYGRWKQKYLLPAGTAANGTQRYRVALGGPGSEERGLTVSEGQGYGMVIVAHLAGHDPNAQGIFDGLWQFARDNPSRLDSRLMSFLVPTTLADRDSAFDGDSDIAYGLLLAHAQWGSIGPVDYGAAARRVLAGMLASTIGPASRLPLLGDWVDPNGWPENQWTPRTSDFMPDHFRAFRRATGNAAWSEVVAACQRVVTGLQTDHSPETGLLPDFVQPVSRTDHTPRPASPGFHEGRHDGHYYYNAGRDPWRLGTDVLVSGDATSRRQTRALSLWAETAHAGRPLRIRAGYFLDGRALPNDEDEPHNYPSSFFIAPFGVAAMSVPVQQPWLNTVYDAVRTREEGYFEDTVTLLCLLVMSGNFWDPTVA